MENSRRDFIRKSALLTLAGLSTQLFSTGSTAGMPSSEASIEGLFTLTPLPYSYDALEPHIDRITMEIHHDKHHQGYVNNLNKALTESGTDQITLEEIFANVSNYSLAIRNNAGGHWNHSFFWKLMKPNGGGIPGGSLLEHINTAFGDFDKFKSTFNDAAAKRFGSGWAWLYLDANKKLSIGSTPNQDNPMMNISELKGVPIMGIDVWEHAYYLKYQNKRGDYISSWWNTINWDQVNNNLLFAEKM